MMTGFDFGPTYHERGWPLDEGAVLEDVDRPHLDDSLREWAPGLINS